MLVNTEFNETNFIFAIIPDAASSMNVSKLSKGELNELGQIVK